MPFWDEVVDEVAKDYPDVELTRFHVDALAALLVLDPGRFDVILGSNLFGDILSDLAAALVGSIGIAPCGNIDPTRRNPSMFEPIHGSAPDIVGKGIANPIGQIWSAAMMLEHLQEFKAASGIIAAIESVIASGTKTPDLSGTHNTDEVTDAVISAYLSSTGVK
jgi:tartrate dehydrogenase/decarboxylase/D-malate dehydrogenase